MRTILLLLLILFNFPWNCSAQVYDFRANKYWGASIVADENGSLVRMGTAINGTSLSLDFFNNVYYLYLSEPTMTFVPENKVDVDIRIDTNNIIKAIGTSVTKNGIFYLMISLPKNSDFIQQAAAGNTLRFKINIPNPFYLRFSLLGFTATFNYAMQLCRRIYPKYNRDEEFFKQKPKNNNRSDETYF